MSKKIDVSHVQSTRHHEYYQVRDSRQYTIVHHSFRVREWEAPVPGAAATFDVDVWRPTGWVAVVKFADDEARDAADAVRIAHSLITVS